MKLSTDKIIERYQEAREEYERLTRWSKEAPRGSNEKRVYKNRKWTIHRKAQHYVDEIERRFGSLTPHILRNHRDG